MVCRHDRISISGTIRGSMRSETKVGETLFEREWIGNATHIARAIFHANDHRASGSVGESDHAAQNALRRVKVALEFQRLAFVRAKQIVEIHGYEIYSEATEGHKLPSRGKGLGCRKECVLFCGSWRP